MRRILLLAVWVVVGRRSASWLSSVATAIHHHLLLLLLLLQDSPVLPVEHLYGLLVRQEGRIGMELLQEDDSPGLRDVQAVHGLKVCRQAQKCGVRQHDGSFSTGYSPEPTKSAPTKSCVVPWCIYTTVPPSFSSSSSPEMHLPETFPEMSTILYLYDGEGVSLAARKSVVPYTEFLLIKPKRSPNRPNRKRMGMLRNGECECWLVFVYKSLVAIVLCTISERIRR